MSEGTQKNLVSEEVAEGQLDIFFDYYDLDPDFGTEEQKKALAGTRRKLIRAIQRGLLTITDEKGVTVTQTLRHPPKGCDDPTITYSKISGKSRLAVKDKDDEYKKMYSLLGHLAGLPLNAIAALQGQDISIAEYLAVLFLAV